VATTVITPSGTSGAVTGTIDIIRIGDDNLPGNCPQFSRNGQNTCRWGDYSAVSVVGNEVRDCWEILVLIHIQADLLQQL
jgi:hypothetical protein